MALIRPSALIGQVSGALGGVIFSHDAAGPKVSHRPIRLRKRTEPSSFSRSLLPHAQSLWRVLSDSDKLNWNNLALNSLYTNRVGLRRSPSGRHLFISYAIYYLVSKTALPHNFPPDGATPLLPVQSSAAEWEPALATFRFHLGFSYRLADVPMSINTYGRASYSTTSLPRTHWRFLASISVRNLIGLTVDSEWTDLLPFPSVDEVVQLKYVWAVEGQRPTTPRISTETVIQIGS